jgi:hypothetical protein
VVGQVIFEGVKAAYPETPFVSLEEGRIYLDDAIVQGEACLDLPHLNPLEVSKGHNGKELVSVGALFNDEVFEVKVGFSNGLGPERALPHKRHDSLDLGADGAAQMRQQGQ